jgi:methyltransferase-like protein/SAM-dependent methyltransferase
MSGAAPSSYDEVPYNEYVFSYTHPACVAAVATLFGMHAADPARCRVLELGCATGANLLPMAYDLPGSQFIGIDSSPRQIDQGRRTVAALGLTNIDLRQGSVLDVNDSFGRFDYIIAHGVYSWVPAEVREGLLAVCKANLAPDGLAYVSFNTYPGWHARGMVREMMTFHVRRIADPAERLRQARALLKFLAQTVADSPYGNLLRREADLVEKSSDAYLYHDHLEEVNAPVYFYQFAEYAAARRLQYLAEALPTPLPQALSPEACNVLERLSGSLVQAEQYLDFIRNRMFRRSLLCHDHIQLQRPPRVEDIHGLYLIGLVRPMGQAKEAAAAVSEEFRGPDSGLWTDYPTLRAALRCLAEAWPAALAFDALWERVRSRLPHLGEAERQNLAESLLRCYFARTVELRACPPALTVEAGERPRASALARVQAAANQPLCNLCHRTVTLEPFDRLVLQQLDGTRGRPALAEALAVGTAKTPDALLPSLDASLDRIARNGLLVAAERP